MEYIVKDISMQYEHGEEIIGTIDASNPDEAIYLALKAISQAMAAAIGDLYSNNLEDFRKYILHNFEAIPRIPYVPISEYMNDFEAIPKEKPCI